MPDQDLIRDLAVISDRRSCALLNKQGDIVWYCPNRFDAAAIFSSLLDTAEGGSWTIRADHKDFLGRRYEGRSSVIHSNFAINGNGFTITDFMAMDADASGICRIFSTAPGAIHHNIKIKGDYGLRQESYRQISATTICIDESGLFLHSSHPLSIDGGSIRLIVGKGERSWAYLGIANELDEDRMHELLEITLQKWRELETLVDYHGPYENQVRYSLRALQQMVYEPSGGIIAAATTSLPEVIAGERNYDYRYVWVRDAALITSSLTQIITNGELEEKFLAFISGAMEKNREEHASCFYAVDGSTLSDKVRQLPLAGYFGSRPVQVGNSAAKQFQLDAEANVLIACSIIYQKSGEIIYWDTVEKIADYICRSWQRKDNGIWEEEQIQHYTSSKAFAARGLELIAPYQSNEQVRKKWLENASMIRAFISEKCITKKGAFSVYPGSDKVDIACALFVPFGIYNAKDPNMLATIAELETNYSDQQLYRRNLLEFDASKEGVFLAGSCWIAHYYAIAGNIQQSKTIIDRVLDYSNDLGYFAEEADTKSGQLLGNFPQTFVHSSFICAVNAYKQALVGKESIIKPKKQ